MRVPTLAQVDEVEIEGGKFLLAPIPDGVWRRLALRSAAASRDAKRRTLLDLKAAGEDVTDDAVGLATFLDVQYRTEMETIQRESVAWAVVGHTVDGLEFKPASREYFGRAYKGASDETVADYADTRLDGGGTLLHALYIEVSEKNSLSAASKKNSVPPSDTTGSGGTATTA